MAEGDGEGQTTGTHSATPDVFISYASQDASVADGVVAALESQGLKCWIAPRDVTPGEFYADAIVRAINEAMILVLVLTENAVTSPHVLREVERTSAKRHSIVSFRIGAVPLPPALEYFLSASHWLDASTSSVESAMPKLIEAVKRLIAPPSGVDQGRTSGSAKRTADLFPHPPGTKSVRRLSRPVIALSSVIALGLAYIAADRLWLSKHATSERSIAAVAPAAAPPAAAISEKSVAVLPFVDMSEKKDQEYFSDGLSEELIDLLAKVPSLRVPARTSSFYFKGKQARIADIGKELSVAHVLEGSVRRSGKSLRITAQLIRVDNGYHVWSQTYDRKLDDVFAIQDDIASAVVAQLKTILMEPAPESWRTDPKAHDLFLQADNVYKRGGPGDWERSITLAKQALAIDPGYVAAWLLLAGAYMNEGDFSLRPVDDAYRLAREAIEKALAINPNSAKAYARLGELEFGYGGDLQVAARHLEHALALDANDGTATSDAAMLAWFLGRTDLAIAMTRAELVRDPMDPYDYQKLGLYYLVGGYLDQSIANERKALQLSPDNLWPHAVIATSLLLKGNIRDATAEYQLAPLEFVRLMGVSMAFHALGEAAKSDAALLELIQKHERDSSFSIAEVLAFRGEADRAFEWLEKAVAYRDPALTTIWTDPLLASIHSDPRLLPFLRRIGRAPEQLAAIKFDVKLPPP